MNKYTHTQPEHSTSLPASQPLQASSLFNMPFRSVSSCVPTKNVTGNHWLPEILRSHNISGIEAFTRIIEKESLPNILTSVGETKASKNKELCFLHPQLKVLQTTYFLWSNKSDQKDIYPIFIPMGENYGVISLGRLNTRDYDYVSIENFLEVMLYITQIKGDPETDRKKEGIIQVLRNLRAYFEDMQRKTLKESGRVRSKNIAKYPRMRVMFQLEKTGYGLQELCQHFQTLLKLLTQLTVSTTLLGVTTASNLLTRFTRVNICDVLGLKAEIPDDQKNATTFDFNKFFKPEDQASDKIMRFLFDATHEALPPPDFFTKRPKELDLLTYLTTYDERMNLGDEVKGINQLLNPIMRIVSDAIDKQVKDKKEAYEMLKKTRKAMRTFRISTVTQERLPQPPPGPGQSNKKRKA